MTSVTGKGGSPARDRKAFTLVELLLVLGLLVIVCAMAAPSLSGGMWRSNMNKASEQVRSAWGQARLDAVAQGQTLRFQCRIGTSWGITASTAIGTAELGAAVDAAQAEAAPTGELDLSGIIFRQLLVAPQPGDAPIGSGVAENELSAAVLFRPDGSTTDAEVILEDEQGRQVRVSLRGLTGVVTVEDVVNE